MKEREQYLELVELLGGCEEPYDVAARVMAPFLGMADEARQEIGRLIDDMGTLARREKRALPEADVAALRRDLREMGRLRQRFELDHLFSAEMRKRCGRYAAPLLAAALIIVWNRVEYASEWLESAEELRILVDALLHRGESEAGTRRGLRAVLSGPPLPPLLSEAPRGPAGAGRRVS